MGRWVAIAVVFLTACAGPSAAPLVPTPQPAATILPVATATTVPAPTAVPTIVLEAHLPTGEYYLGAANAPLIFEMFGDFQCPACGEFARTIEPPFIQSYVDTGKVKLVWHDYAWIGAESFDAAQAARCAGRQGHFWAFHNYLYAHQRGENLGQFSPTNLNAYALAVGLDRAAFETCFNSAQDLPAIKDAVRDGISKGIDVTPSFLINGDLKVGAPPLNRLSALMDYYLVRANH